MPLLFDLQLFGATGVIYESRTAYGEQKVSARVIFDDALPVTLFPTLFLCSSFTKSFPYFHWLECLKNSCSDRVPGTLVLRRFLSQSRERILMVINDTANDIPQFAEASLGDCITNGEPLDAKATSAFRTGYGKKLVAQRTECMFTR